MLTRSALLGKGAVVAFLLMIFWVTSAQAQRSGEVLQMLEKKDLSPPLKDQPPKQPVIEQESQKSEKAKLEGSKKVLVKKFKIEGNTLLDAKTINAFIGPQEGKEMSLEEIVTIAELLTAKYRDLGYIIANAYIPTQEIKDGVVVIKVVEGKIGTITVTGNKYYRTPFIEKYLGEIKKDPSLKEGTLERSLMLLNDYPSLNITSMLKAGKEPGTTDLIAKVTDKFPISGRIFYDSFGSETTSKQRAGFTGSVGNLLTSGDSLDLWGITGLHKVDVRDLSYGRIEYLVPVGSDGAKAGAYFSNSAYRAGLTLEPLEIWGTAQVAGAYLSYPILKKRDATLSFKGGFDYKDVKEYMLDSLRSQDNIRVGTISISYDFSDRFLGRSFVSLGYHKGIPGILGGSFTSNTNLSRLNGNPDFNKVTIDAMRIQKLPGYNHFILRGSGQYSPDQLLIAEQFMIGGAGSVRSYKPAEKTGDFGYALSAELVFSPLLPEMVLGPATLKAKVGDTIKFALFVDHAGVNRNNPLPGEEASTNLTSMGGGIRLLGGRYFSLKVDYAAPWIGNRWDLGKGETLLQAVVNF